MEDSYDVNLIRCEAHDLAVPPDNDVMPELFVLPERLLHGPLHGAFHFSDFRIHQF